MSTQRLAPLTRQLPDPQMLKEYLQLDLPTGDRRSRRLEKAADIWDLRKIAKRRTPKGPFDYVDGASEREISLQRAYETFDNLAFKPSVLRDVADVDLSTTMCGGKSSMPLAIAPTGFTRMMHSEGEVAGARAAAQAGIPFSLSTVGTTTIERVAEAAPDGRHWFQLYMWRGNRAKSRELVRRAKDAGYDSLMVTVDCAVGGARHRDKRNGMTFPPKLTAKTFLDASYRFEWWINFLTTPALAFDNIGGGAMNIQEVFNMFDPSLNFKELEWVREEWDGHMLIKGIQTPEDAKRCIESGVDGVVLSNHGGRQLDRAPVPLLTLPHVRELVGPDPTVLVDTGIMSGADVIAACALGADGALIGRAYLYSLMAGGGEGVVRGLEIFREEMIRTMSLMGVRTIAELTPDRVSFDWHDHSQYAEPVTSN